MAGWQDFLKDLQNQYGSVENSVNNSSLAKPADNLSDIIEQLKNKLRGTSSVLGQQSSSQTNPWLQALNSAQNTQRLGTESLQDQYQNDVKTGATGATSLGQGMSAPMSIADQLQQQLQGIQVHTTPLDELQKQANAQVSAQYDPQINALLRDMGSTKQRATTNEGQATSMYNALSQDAANQIPGAQQQSQQDQAATSSRYNDAQTNLQQQYQQQSQQQQAVLQQLGIQAAAPDATGQQKADQSYFQQANDLSKNQALDQVQSQGTADQSYLRNQSTTDKLAGTNASNDIASQLEQYLQGAQGQVEDLKGAKANSIASVLQGLQQSDQQSAETSYNDQFNQMMQLNNLQRGLTNDQNSSQLDQQKLALQQQQLQQSAQPKSPFTGTSGMDGMANFLSEKYPTNPNEASTLSSLVASVLANPDVENGRRTQGTSSVPITNEYLIQLLRNQAGKAGVTGQGDINNAIDAMLAYKGQLR